MTKSMIWRNKSAKRTIGQIPVLTTEEKLALKVRIAEALLKAGLSPTAMVWDMK